MYKSIHTETVCLKMCNIFRFDVYLISMRTHFCILYDRCLYACWIDLFYRCFISILDGSHCFQVGADIVRLDLGIRIHS